MMSILYTRFLRTPDTVHILQQTGNVRIGNSEHGRRRTVMLQIASRAGPEHHLANENRNTGRQLGAQAERVWLP